jgi:putative SOS response-associated peptidase YedK
VPHLGDLPRTPLATAIGRILGDPSRRSITGSQDPRLRHIFSTPPALLCHPMCERYVLPDQLAAEREFMPARSWWNFTAKFNVAAQQYVPAIRWHEGESEAVMLRWGLIPSWAEGKWVGVPPACVDIDEIQTSPTYKPSWLNSQRCIVPVAGFYAWQLTQAKYRQPFFVRLLERSVFGVAGIWDRSVGEDDDVIESCSLIRLQANDLMTTIDNTERRMPAILRRKDYQTWLRGTPVEAREALQPYKPNWMEAYPVSPRINSTAPDDPDLIRPVAQAIRELAGVVS